jgi:hypothetical protein
MAEKKGTSQRSSKVRSSRRDRRKMDAVSLVKLLRKHGTLTLTVCVSLVSLFAGYLAIDLGA